MSNKEEAEKIGDFIYEKSKQVLREVVAECLQREPTGTEFSIASSSFLMGACCAAQALIDGIEQQNIIARN